MSERTTHIGADGNTPSTTPCEETDYGFTWGPATVDRLMSDSRKGWVLLSIQTKRQRVQVYVTPTGLIRVQPIRPNQKGT